MLIPRSSTAGSGKQSRIPLMVDLLRELPPALIPGKDAELLQPTVIDTRTSRTIMRLPGRGIGRPRAYNLQSYDKKYLVSSHILS